MGGLSVQLGVGGPFHLGGPSVQGSIRPGGPSVLGAVCPSGGSPPCPQFTEMPIKSGGCLKKWTFPFFKPQPSPPVEGTSSKLPFGIGHWEVACVFLAAGPVSHCSPTIHPPYPSAHSSAVADRSSREPQSRVYAQARDTRGPAWPAPNHPLVPNLHCVPSLGLHPAVCNPPTSGATAAGAMVASMDYPYPNVVIMHPRNIKVPY